MAWTDLIEDFDSMGGTVPVPPAPAPAPPAPTPPAPTPPAPPAPVTAVTLAQATAWADAGLKGVHNVMTRAQAEAAVAYSLTKNWPAHAPKH